MATPKPPAECPMHEKPAPPPECPMHQKKKPEPPPSCPMHNGPVTEKLNELNMMPSQLSQQPQQDQQIELPTERVISSIPKADGASKWEYPSPQQFYNALRRKGWETPEEQIETMVDIHNYLNEGAWEEVLRWESMRDCECKEEPYLVRLQGKPGQLSPKARFFSWFGSPKPFDRHDWYVGRCGKERRYIIDYYEAPEEQPGVPVFSLDIRPALDDPESVFCRLKAAAKEKWEEWFPNNA